MVTIKKLAATFVIGCLLWQMPGSVAAQQADGAPSSAWYSWERLEAILKSDKNFGSQDKAVASKEPGIELIIEVRVVGNEKIPMEEILSCIRTRAGMEFNKSRIYHDVCRLLESRKFRDIRPDMKKCSKGVLVTFHVSEFPNDLAEVIFRNVHHISQEDLEEMTREVRKGWPLNPSVNIKACRDIQNYLKHVQGRYWANVVLEEGARGTDHRVIINVSEGPVLRVRSIQFVGGSELASPAEFRSQILTSQSFMGCLGVFNETLVEGDVKKLENYCIANGYRFASVRRELIFNDDYNAVDIVFHIHAGVRCRIDDGIDFAGMIKSPIVEKEEPSPRREPDYDIPVWAGFARLRVFFGRAPEGSDHLCCLTISLCIPAGGVTEEQLSTAAGDGIAFCTEFVTGIFSSPEEGPTSNDVGVNLAAVLKILAEITDGAERGRALASLNKEPLQNGGTQEQQDMSIKLLVKAAIVTPHIINWKPPYVINTDPDNLEPLIRLGAIRALGEYKDPRAVQALKAVYLGYDPNGGYWQSPMPFLPEINGKIKIQALTALGKTGSQTARDLFLMIAASPGPSRRSAVAEQNMTDDERLAALRGLARFHDREVLNTLVDVMEMDKSIALRNRAHISLKTITGADLPQDPAAWRKLFQKIQDGQDN